MTDTTQTPDRTEYCVKVYTPFNRLWHWSQAASILILVFTGLRIAGLHSLIPFKAAVGIHTITALALLLLWIFATFWLFTTGAWKQFLPRSKGFLTMVKFYAWGVFHGEHSPYRKKLKQRHNPLQAATYMALKMVLFPAIWSTGIIYLLHTFWSDLDRGSFWLTIVANLHILAGFAIIAFVIAHLYLLTIGGFRKHVAPMITGFDRINLTKEEAAYLKQDEPGRLRETRD